MRDRQKRDFARRLRSGMTDAEQHLWRHLRQRQVDGHRFRRQHPIGPYIADFACLQAGLVVERDGGQHAESRADANRTGFIESAGYQVLRFWNNDVLTQTDAVLAVIFDALTARCPHPNPLP